MSGRAWRVSLPCAGLLLLSSEVEAQGAPPPITAVTLDLPRCSEPPYDAAQLLEHLRLELSARGLQLSMPAEASTPEELFRIQLVLPRCASNSAELTLRVLEPGGRGAWERTLALAELPFEARPRTLALSIAEALGRSSRPAPAPASLAAAPEPAPAELPARPPGSHELQESSLQLGLSAQHRTPVLSAHPFWGGELSASRATLSDDLGWAADVGFATRTTDTRLGEMRTDWWSVGLGLDLRERGLVELAVGPRLALAYVSARPEPTSAAPEPTTEALLVLWGAGVELALPLGRRWRLRGTVDLEQPFRGLVLTAGGERAVSLEGWLLSSGLGLAFRP